jgi:hypothetical protein
VASSPPQQAAGGTEATAAGSTAGAVPDGTMAEVLAWAGSDPGRVQAAYDAELTRPSPRSTLLQELDARGAVG